MEESSNGKIEETDKVQTEEVNDEKLVICDAEDPKSEADPESVIEILVDENSGSLDGDDDHAEEKEEAIEESCIIPDLEVLEKEEEEKEVIINSILDSDELIVETTPVDYSDVIEVELLGIDEKNQVESQVIGETEIESKGIDEKNQVESQVIGDTEIESKGIDETEEVEPEGIDVGLLNGAKETMWPESTPIKTNCGPSEVRLNETEDKISPSMVDKDEQSESAADDDASKGIEKEVVLVSENSVLPAVVTRGIEEIKVEENSTVIVDKRPVDKIDDSLKPSPNAIIIGSNDAFPETGRNPHVISITKRTMQPTTWRSCWGLFEVLKRSNR